MYLLGRHGTALLVIVGGVTHGVPGRGVAGHGRGGGAVAVVLRGLHVVVVFTVLGEVAALRVVVTGRELGVHPRVAGVHQE